jgi:hypothetical protein
MPHSLDRMDACGALASTETYDQHDSQDLSLLELAAEQLVAESAIDMISSDGGVVEVWTLSSLETVVRATAPRLSVREGISLRADMLVDGLPYMVTATVEEAGYRSPSRAALLLHVTDVSPTGKRRFEERTPVANQVSITAKECDRLLDGVRMETVAVDVSTSGIGISCLDARVRTGDVFGLHCRFIHGVVEQDVRVMRTTSFDSGQRIVGCMFIDPTAATNVVIDRTLSRRADD